MRCAWRWKVGGTMASGQRASVSVTWISDGDTSWPIDNGETAWSLRYQHKMYDAAALADAYASLLHPERTMQDAINMLRRARRAQLAALGEDQ